MNLRKVRFGSTLDETTSDIEYHTRKPPSKIEDLRDVLRTTSPPEDSE